LVPQSSARLDAIGLETGTDKSSVHHNYLVFYERFFEPLRQAPIKMLEVGVFQGASLKMWERYFPNASIVGADINRDAQRFVTERTSIEIVDQSNLQDLVDLGMKHGPFDIIIEDGSHLWEHQITTLRTLFPFLKQGGYYVAEDLQTNFGNLVANYQGVGSISCVEYLKRLVDFRVGDEEVDITVEEDPFLRTYGRAVDFIAFSRHVCLIQKKTKKIKGSTFVITPLVRVGANDAIHAARMLAHIGNFGDVINPDAAFINIDEASNSFIQGFQLYIAPELASQLEYRGRLPDGAWTDWETGNGFVGSRGKGDNLTGVSVRLRGGLQHDYNVEVIGGFRGDPDVVVVGDGQDCVSRISRQPLRGLQIRLVQKQLGVPN
jgi:hypothetical protein